MKDALNEYTEAEFLDVVKKAYTAELPDDEMDNLVAFFDSTGHPKGAAILTHPSTLGLDDTPEAVVQELKRWSLENGENCFKDA